MRDASLAASKRLSELDVEISMRKDIFDRVCAFQKAFGPDYEGLSDEQRRFVEKEVVLGKRNGKEELRSCNEEKAFPPMYYSSSSDKASTWMRRHARRSRP